MTNNHDAGWQPIARYDQAKDKPPNCVFLLQAVPGRIALARKISTERTFGFRVTTHYCQLPDLPANETCNRPDCESPALCIGTDGIVCRKHFLETNGPKEP